MKEAAVVKALAALAQPIRLQLFRALVVAGEQGMTPGTMAQGMGISPSSLSFHLKELTHAGLLTQERSSRNLVYRAAYEQMNSLLGYLTQNCCQGAECGVKPAQLPMDRIGKPGLQQRSKRSAGTEPHP